MPLNLKKQNSKHIVTSLFILLFALALFKTAWITEDAYITFRTVDNFVNGFGLTWNVSERVQSFTHPLWMFILSFLYFFTHEIYYSSIIISFIFSIAAVIIITFSVSRSYTASLAVILIFSFSKGFTEYSTSGLENSLSHFLLALFLMFFFNSFNKEHNIKDFFILCAITAFGALNRMDTILIYLPAIFLYGLKLRKSRAILNALLAFFPFILWLAFSLFYYGSLFPNTAYAKLNTGISESKLLMQGLYYFLDSIIRDPITLPIIFLGTIMPAIKRDWKNMALSVGILFYLFYIVKIGGDFMSGRFLTIPLFCGSAVISRYNFSTQKFVLLFIFIFAAGSYSAQIPVLSNASFGADGTGIVNQHGISDERRAYYPHTGLLKSFYKAKWPDHRWSVTGSNAKAASEKMLESRNAKSVSLYQTGTTVGLYGYFAGPHVHIIDELSLCEPLLARLPAADPEWRPGHFKRNIPDGYIETLVFNQNRIRSNSLNQFYDKLKYIIRGNLFDFRRITEIWHMNTGKYNSLLKQPDLITVNRFKNKSHNSMAEAMLESIKENYDDPMRYVYLYYRFGQLYFKEGSFKKAENQYITALAINPFHLNAQNSLAELYAETGQTEKAISAFKRLKKISKSIPEVDYNIACLYARTGHIEKSINWLKKAIEAGYCNWDAIKFDKDLENIRNSPQYKEIIKLKSVH